MLDDGRKVETVRASLAHVSFCFETLQSHFDGSPVQTRLSVASHPLFVTWNKLDSSSRYVLRGCIGSLQTKYLPEGLAEYALNSALRDKRFSPITAEELPYLQCSVSLLHSFENAASWDDWTVGKHGIIANFQEPGGRQRSATYLPEVAAHEDWSQDQALQTLIRKAGYRGSLQSVMSTLKVTRYQSSAASLTFKEYQSRSRNLNAEDQMSVDGVAYA